jgi:hypothetical protein
VRVEVVVAGLEDLASAAAVLEGWVGSDPDVDPERLRIGVAVVGTAVTMPAVVRRLDAAGVAVPVPASSVPPSTRCSCISSAPPATTPPTRRRPRHDVLDAGSRPLVDGAAAAARVLAKLRHDPAGIALTLAAPVVLVLVFGYIFGSASAVPGSGDYREFLVPGCSSPSRSTSVDRSRSMPISRIAVPFGQAAATAVYGLLCLLMAICGLLVGWRIRTGIGPAAGALGLLVAFRFAAT